MPRFGYVLIYDPQTDPVEILRFVHTRRDLPRVLADLWDTPEN
jgi:plasmid stabilization system protein ParE